MKPKNLSEGSFSGWWTIQKQSVKAALKKVAKEVMETKEASRIMLRIMKGHPTSIEEKNFLKGQILDVIKTLGLAGIVSLPGGLFIVIIVVQVAKKMGLDIVPSSFKESVGPMVVTFDFDDTLRYATGMPVEKYIGAFKKHMSDGHEVHIVTSRMMSKKSLQEIKVFAMTHGIKPKSILHTDSKVKAPTLQNIGSVLHYDDDEEELEAASKVGIRTIDTWDDKAKSEWQKYMDSL